MAAVSIDTNVLISLLVARHDPAQNRAASALLAKRQSIHLADLAVTETVFVLANYYKIDRTLIVDSLEELFANPQLVVNRDLFSQALEVYRQRPALSFEDCCLAVYAHLDNAEPLLTFDKKLANQAPYTDLLAV